MIERVTDAVGEALGLLTLEVRVFLDLTERRFPVHRSIVPDREAGADSVVHRVVQLPLRRAQLAGEAVQRQGDQAAFDLRVVEVVAQPPQPLQGGCQRHALQLTTAHLDHGLVGDAVLGRMGRLADRLIAVGGLLELGGLHIP